MAGTATGGRCSGPIPSRLPGGEMAGGRVNMAAVSQRPSFSLVDDTNAPHRYEWWSILARQLLQQPAALCYVLGSA